MPKTKLPDTLKYLQKVNSDLRFREATQNAQESLNAILTSDRYVRANEVLSKLGESLKKSVKPVSELNLQPYSKYFLGEREPKESIFPNNFDYTYLSKVSSCAISNQHPTCQTNAITGASLSGNSNTKKDYFIEFDGVDIIFTFKGLRSSIRDHFQIRYVVFLLLHSGEEFTNLDIWTKVKPQSREPEKLERLSKSGAIEGIEMIDQKTITAVKNEIEKLKIEIESAKIEGYLNKADKLSDTKEKYESYLSKNTGIDSRPRKTSSLHDSARITIVNGINRCVALLKKTPNGGPLSEHIRKSIVNGSPRCRLYRPSYLVEWSIKKVPGIVLW